MHTCVEFTIILYSRFAGIESSGNDRPTLPSSRVRQVFLFLLFFIPVEQLALMTTTYTEWRVRVCRAVSYLNSRRRHVSAKWITRCDLRVRCRCSNNWIRDGPARAVRDPI